MFLHFVLGKLGVRVVRIQKGISFGFFPVIDTLNGLLDVIVQLLYILCCNNLVYPLSLKCSISLFDLGPNTFSH